MLKRCSDHLPLDLLAAGGDLRIALLRFDFVFQLLRRHPQVLLVLPVLIAVVEEGEHGQRAADLEAGPEQTC